MKYKWRWSVYRIDDISMKIQLISNIYCNQILSVQSLFWRTKIKSRLYNHDSISNNWNNLFGTKIKDNISNIFHHALFNGSNGSDVRGYINIIADLQSMDYVFWFDIRIQNYLYSMCILQAFENPQHGTYERLYKMESFSGACFYTKCKRYGLFQSWRR